MDVEAVQRPSMNKTDESVSHNKKTDGDDVLYMTLFILEERHDHNTQLLDADACRTRQQLLDGYNA